MDNPNITMEEYIRLEVERAQKRREMFNWQTARFGRIEHYYEDEYFMDFESEFPAIVLGNTNAISSQRTKLREYEAKKEDSEIEFPAIVLNDAPTSDTTLSYEPTVSIPSNDKIDFRISFGESDNEDYTPSKSSQSYDENEKSSSKYDKKEQKALTRSNPLPFCKIYPDNSKWDRHDDDNKMQSSKNNTKGSY
ncbi:hypothetical protein Tco_0900381 [Tanacetum coccineum]